jgi:hypothetical protein
VLLGWPLFGMLIETDGFVLLFRYVVPVFKYHILVIPEYYKILYTMLEIVVQFLCHGKLYRSLSSHSEQFRHTLQQEKNKKWKNNTLEYTLGNFVLKIKPLR